MNEYDRPFSPADKARLNQHLGIPMPHMVLEEAYTILRSHKPQNTQIESAVFVLPAEADGIITEKVLYEDIFERFFVKNKEADVIKRGENFLAFFKKWKRDSEKRFLKNTNYSSYVAIRLVEKITPASVHQYALDKQSRISKNIEGMSPDNLDLPYAQESLRKWKLYEDTARVTSFLQKTKNNPPKKLYSAGD